MATATSCSVKNSKNLNVTAIYRLQVSTFTVLPVLLISLIFPSYQKIAINVMQYLFKQHT